MTVDAIASAMSLLDAVQDEPAHVVEAAGSMVTTAAPGSEARVVARYALGRAQHEIGDIDAACRTLETAAAEARAAGHAGWEGHIRGSLALSLSTHGETQSAHRQLDLAEALLDGAARARMTMQRAIMNVHEGNLAAGLRAFDDALPVLDEAGDDLAVARLLISRGVAHSLLGNDDAAEADYKAGGSRADRLEQQVLAASARANIAFSQGRRGDIPASLASFESARRAYVESGNPRRYLAALEADLGEVLLSAGLHDEAHESASRALELAREGENRVQEGEALLMVARAALADGRSSDAVGAALDAKNLLASSSRPAWAAQAHYLATVADPATSLVDRVDELTALAETLASFGWTAESLQVRTMLGAALIDHGQADRGREQLELAAAGRHRGTVEQRSRAWHAEALARRAAGDLHAARSAVMAGLRLVDEFRDLLGATELRLHSGHRRRALVQLGLELAIATGTTDDVLAWAGRARDGSLTLPPARPSDDPAIARLTADHRRLSAEARSAAGDQDRVASIELALESTEHHLRSALRRTPGVARRSTDEVSIAELRRRLGPRTLVHFYEIGDRLCAVAISPESTIDADLTAITDVEARLGSMFFGLRRLASGFGSEAGLAAAARSVIADGDWLFSSLLERLRGDAEEIVLVPSDAIADVPWNMVVAGRRLAVTVAPSARLWLRPADRRDGVRVAIAGPGLPAASREVTSLGRRPTTRVITGDDATVEATLDALSSAAVVHLAAHGRFRSDSPLFSSLTMADGALTVVDIERLITVPRMVVLSACHAARGSVGIPGEVLGAGHALIGAGASSVVAPVVAVADDAMADVMEAFHEEVDRGHRAPIALSRLVADRPAVDDSIERWTARLLVVIGTDDGAGATAASA